MKSTSSLQKFSRADGSSKFKIYHRETAQIMSPRNTRKRNCEYPDFYNFRFGNVRYL